MDDDDKKKPADDDDSDVELEGLDLEGDEEAADVVEDSEKLSNADNTMDEDEDISVEQRAHEDHDEMEAARKERMELMAAEAKQIASGTSMGKASVEEQLQYLLGQSEVFAHFLAGA